MIFINIFDLFNNTDIFTMLFVSFAFCGVMFCIQKLVLGKGKCDL